MRSIIVLGICVAGVCVPVGIAASEPSAAELLRMIDRSRAPYDSFRQEIVIHEIEDRRVVQASRLSVLHQEYEDGTTASVALFREPRRMRGRKVLMDAADTWLYVPGSSRAIRVSLAQRLTGGVATGDVLAINYERSYRARRLENAIVNERAVYTVELTATTTHVTYYRIVVYVDTELRRPLLAEYRSRSGRVLKTGYYTAYEIVGSRAINVELVLVDHLADGATTVVRSASFEPQRFPLHYFNPASLRELAF